MKSNNTLTYEDVEMLLYALEQTEEHEGMYADHLWHTGEQEIAAPHYEYADECHRLIKKLRALEFQYMKLCRGWMVDNEKEV